MLFAAVGIETEPWFLPPGLVTPCAVVVVSGALLEVADGPASLQDGVTKALDFLARTHKETKTKMEGKHTKRRRRDGEVNKVVLHFGHYGLLVDHQEIIALSIVVGSSD